MDINKNKNIYAFLKKFIHTFLQLKTSNISLITAKVKNFIVVLILMNTPLKILFNVRIY